VLERNRKMVINNLYRTALISNRLINDLSKFFLLRDQWAQATKRCLTSWYSPIGFYKQQNVASQLFDTGVETTLKMIL
jgi:hypothetical protein